MKDADIWTAFGVGCFTGAMVLLSVLTAVEWWLAS